MKNHYSTFFKVIFVTMGYKWQGLVMKYEGKGNTRGPVLQDP